MTYNKKMNILSVVLGVVIVVLLVLKSYNVL